jgi:tetratricopeptide (TPR) repeat protein
MQIDHQIMEHKLSLNQEKAVTYYNRGNQKFRTGDESGAIKNYSKAINCLPRFAAAYHNRGTAKAKSGDITGAIEDYNSAIEINSDLVAAYSNRGRAKLEIGDPQGAAQDYHRASEQIKSSKNNNSLSDLFYQ